MKNTKIKNDIILIAVILVIAAIGIVVFMLTSKDGAKAVVTVDGNVVAEYDLNTDTEEIIYSQNGCYNKIVIKNGKASVESASCPDLICVGHREISKQGETIVCLPNKLVVSIQSSQGDDIIS